MKIQNTLFPKYLLLAFISMIILLSSITSAQDNFEEYLNKQDSCNFNDVCEFGEDSDSCSQDCSTDLNLTPEQLSFIEKIKSQKADRSAEYKFTKDLNRAESNINELFTPIQQQETSGPMSAISIVFIVLAIIISLILIIFFLSRYIQKRSQQPPLE